MAEIKEKLKSEKTRKNSVFSNGNAKIDAISEASKDSDEGPKLNENDIYNELKSVYFKNILKFEQHHNSGLSASVNNLNDFEIKEIVANIEYYVNLCINSIKENDSIFNVNIKQNSNLNKKNIAEDHQHQNTSKKLFPAIDDFKNDIINIKSLISYDLIHHGLKAGPIQRVQINKEFKPKKQVTILTNIKENTLTSNSLLSSNKFDSNRKTIRSQPHATQSRNSVIFKYLIVMELNTDYFSTINSMNDNNLFKIQLLRKPTSWSSHDYESLTVNIKETRKDYSNRFNSSSLNSLHSSIDSTLSASLNSFSNNENKKKSNINNGKRFLNSKGLLDRIYKQFHIVFRNWSGQRSNDQLKYPVNLDQQSKTSQVVNNQLKITMHYKGNKLKDIEIIILISTAIKYNDLYIEDNLEQSLKNIISNYLTSYGCKYLNNSTLVISDEVIEKLIKYSEEIYNLNLKNIYLSADSGISCWSLNLLPIKLNLIKFLCCLSSLNANNLNPQSLNLLMDLFNITLDDLANNVNVISLTNKTDTTTQVNTKLVTNVNGLVNIAIQNNSRSNSITTQGIQKNANPQMIISVAPANKNRTLEPILNNCSTLFVSIKVIQIIIYLGFNSINLAEKFDTDSQNEEELLANLALNEINKFSDKGWSSENVFDRIWSIFIDLRNSLTNLKMKDQFNIIDNVLPKSWINYIGFYTLPILNNRTRVFDLYNDNNQINNNKKTEILRAIDVGMKNLLTTVSPQENDFNLFNYSRELTRINEDIDIVSPFIGVQDQENNSRRGKSFKKKYDTTTLAVSRTNLTAKKLDEITSLLDENDEK